MLRPKHLATIAKPHAFASFFSLSLLLYFIASLLLCAPSPRFFHLLHSIYNFNRGQIAIMPDYTAEHAAAGIKTKLPALETWPNQFPNYVITTKFPEYSSVCPKTGLPDFGTITIQYVPRKHCIELKSLKMYLLAYRDLGIFYENSVNKMLRDIVAAIDPEWCVVKGEFTPRGGLNTNIYARWPELTSTAKATSKAGKSRK
jgi:7-cyano-7-deazaguanine reductase